jgi:hypothetical protein
MLLEVSPMRTVSRGVALLFALVTVAGCGTGSGGDGEPKGAVDGASQDVAVEGDAPHGNDASVGLDAGMDCPASARWR